MKKFSELTKVLSEKRAHADMNEKEWVAKYLMDNINNNNLYLHFSNINKVGIKPRNEWDTPQGVYGWQLNAYKKTIKKIVSDVSADAKQTMGQKTYFDTMNDKEKYLTTQRAKGDGSGVFLTGVFPFRDDSTYLHVIEAKSGLRWLKLHGGNHTLDDFLDILNAIEIYWSHNADTMGYMRREMNADRTPVYKFTQEQISMMKRYYQLDDSEIQKVIEKLYDEYKTNKQSQLSTIWYFRKEYIMYYIYSYMNRGNAFSVGAYMLLKIVCKKLSRNDAQVAISMNAILRAAGFDAVRDDGEGILFNDDESNQVVFLHAGAYTVKKTLLNTSLPRSTRAKVFGKGA
ncbi:MAG: hypothetical protein BV459_07820 [Thermoplasmata archaeon M11B2D]|nr:MAG: hypothetical protein BV459_07820 [Thermoplasmata archaeon M11B2D]